MVDSDPHLHWCPNPDWELGYVEYPGAIIKAPTLGECQWHYKFWLRCYEKWEPNHSCKTNVRKNYGRFINKSQVKNWPMCKNVIEKLEGWLHMTWSICKYEFWWAWGKHYTAGHLDDPLNAWETYDDHWWKRKLSWIVFLPIQLMVWPFSIWMDSHEGSKKGTWWHSLWYWKCLHYPFIECIYLILAMLVTMTLGLALLALCPIICIPLCFKLLFCNKQRRVIADF